MSNFLRDTPTVSIQGSVQEGGWERALVPLPKDKRGNLKTSWARGRFLGKSSDSLGCEEGVTAGETQAGSVWSIRTAVPVIHAAIQPGKGRKAADCAGSSTGWHFGPSQDSGGMMPSTELR